MIKGYRIVKKKHESSAFDGEGSRLYGGRWNSVGTSCVYLASSESLAMLEVLVHLNNVDILDQYTLFEFEFKTSEMVALDNKFLPGNWNDNPSPPETAQIGDEWVESTCSLVLRIPSSVVQREYNYLININHPSFKKAKSKAKKIPFTFDSRLHN
ncbi:RES family NAD+ phosphorylase [Thalassotalea piscium]|uniref:RES domain-containing protein n=1 Tax=Thalassotalea piscium TaxID=1230533 RepID=A0A7X0TV14_9GAMM|nr:RES family NAD+ phosphorylase [Thalassotalea piscium]MBB6544783.1 RES domain-containing protein [Thalassotalea piscium]